MPRDVTNITQRLSRVTHELKGELHGIIQKTDALLANPDLPVWIREELLLVTAQIDRAKIRSEDMKVSVSLLLNQKPEPAAAPFFVHHVVRSIMKTASIARNGRPHAVEVSSAISSHAEYRRVRVDRRLLELAVLNIVDGACSSSRDDAPVVVQVMDQRNRNSSRT
jgi:K+-sensing histidine kinase KdpD